MEPMKGKWASSRVDFGFTELFCIPEVHQCSSRFVTVFLETLWCSIKKIEAPTCLIGNTILLFMKCREIKPHLPARGMCHVISRVAAGTWGIYASQAGMDIRNSTLFSEVRTPVLLRQTTQESKLGLKG